MKCDRLEKDHTKHETVHTIVTQEKHTQASGALARLSEMCTCTNQWQQPHKTERI